MRNIFLEKSCKKYDGETSPRPFFKKSKLNISLDQQSEVSYSFFSLYALVEDYQNIWKLRCWPLAFIAYKAFLKNKERSGLHISCFIFEEKLFSLKILLIDQISCLIVFTFWDIRQYVYWNCLLSSEWRHKNWNLP